MQFRPLFTDKRNLITALALLFFGVVACAEPPDDIKPLTPAPVPDVVFPIQPIPAPVDPLPVDPTAKLTLTTSTFYILTTNVDAVVTSSPLGLVKITKEAGPITIRGVFVDSNGKTVTRKYTGKNIYYVDAVASGDVEILVIKTGVTDESKILRNSITVDAGTTPPKPPVPPGPGPDPKPPGPTPAPLPGDGLQVLIVYDGDPNTLPLPQQAIIFGQDVRTYLDSHCAKLPNGQPARRMYPKKTDVSQGEEVWKTGMKLAEGQKLPFVVISNPQKGGGFKGDLPATADDFMKLVKKYGGD